ncbi:MAG: efflux RND transporter permease subunit, partial [Polyangiaceae bacterium]|nr:efflux RND transporter permease subunit [Polyangiaceae bacterium]
MFLQTIIHFCVQRRLAVLVVTILIALYGIKSFFDTPIEAYPDVTNYQVNIIAQIPGLAPEEMERQVTIPLERALNGTPDMVLMRSQSLFELSLISMVFADDVDVFKARTVANERIALAELPAEAEVRLAPDATPLGRIMLLRLTSDRHDLTEIRSEAEWTLSRVFRQVPGVADVIPFGGYLREVHVQVDPSRLLAHDITLDDVAEALDGSNRNVGGGFLAHGGQEMMVRGVGYLTNAREIREVVLRNENGTPVTVGDVARLVLSRTPRRGAIGHDTVDEVVEVYVVMRRGENPSMVLEGVHAKLDELNEKILPAGMKAEIFYDRGRLVGQTLSTVLHNLLHGALLVAGVVWLFLRSFRCSLVVASVIPLALLVAFIGLKSIGLPANLISMGAIDFGILVDAGVIMVESVLHQAQRHGRPETKRDVLKLILVAARDVSKPAFFAMSIIIAALIPIFSLESVEGRIFKPLALTYSFALGGALVFALTAVPAFCAIILRPQDLAVSEPKTFERIRSGYEGMVRWVMGHRAFVLSVAAVVLVTGGVVASRASTEFLPELDEGDFFIFSEAPASVSLETSGELIREVRKRVLQFPEVMEVMSELGRPEDGTDNEGVNMGKTLVRLAPREAWRAGWDKDRLGRAIRDSLSEIPGVRFNISQPIKDSVEEAVSGIRGKVVLKIYGTDLGQMRDTLVKCLNPLQSVPGIVDLSLYRDANVPQLQVILDRSALARS